MNAGGWAALFVLDTFATALVSVGIMNLLDLREEKRAKARARWTVQRVEYGDSNVLIGVQRGYDEHGVFRACDTYGKPVQVALVDLTSTGWEEKVWAAVGEARTVADTLNAVID